MSRTCDVKEDWIIAEKQFLKHNRHRDKAVFGETVGVSHLSPCVLRLRRKAGEKKRERANVKAEPRSAYLLAGAARAAWEHSIPPVDALRYSITFRNLREV